MRHYAFTHRLNADMNLMYEAALGNIAAAQRMYMEPYTGRNLPDKQTFEHLHRELSSSGLF